MTPEQFTEWLDKEAEKFEGHAFTAEMYYKAGATAAYNLLSGDDGWIRMEDGLPDTGGLFLLYDENRIEKGVEMGSWYANQFENWFGVPLKKVTHWRPLPEAPTVKK